jgi:quercetin dioxygenase-like cupin family protein
MKVVSLDNVEKNQVTIDGVVGTWKQIPLGSHENTPVYSFRVFTVEPGGNTPYHQHSFEHMNYIIEGEGVLVNEKGEEFPLKPGNFALVEPDEKHQFFNRGNKPFKMICGVPKEFE